MELVVGMVISMIALSVGALVASVVMSKVSKSQIQAAKAEASGQYAALQNQAQTQDKQIEQLQAERNSFRKDAEGKNSEIVRLSERLARYGEAEEWMKGAFKTVTETGFQGVSKSLTALDTRIGDLTAAKNELTTQCTSLVNAFKRSDVRGNYGELQLERVLEYAGMQEGIHYHTQASKEGDRPDMVVHLPKDRNVVIDSKVPGAAFVTAIETDDGEVKVSAFTQHANAMRSRVKELSTKQYWRQFESLEYVIMFVPSEAMYLAALQYDGDLTVYALERKVAIATPATIMGQLAAIHYAWQQHNLEESTIEIGNQARELYNRVRTFVGHLEGVGKALDTSVAAWNKAVGSFRERLKVQGERVEQLILPDKSMPELIEIKDELRELDEQANDSGESG